MDKLVNSVNLN